MHVFGLWDFWIFSLCVGAGLSPDRPGPGHLWEERAAGEVLPRGEGQGRGPEGAEPGLQGHRDGARGTGRGPQRADGGHRPEGPAAEGVLPGQTGRRTHRWEINHHKWRVAVIYSSDPNPRHSVLFSRGEKCFFPFFFLKQLLTSNRFSYSIFG